MSNSSSSGPERTASLVLPDSPTRHAATAGTQLHWTCSVLFPLLCTAVSIITNCCSICAQGKAIYASASARRPAGGQPGGGAAVLGPTLRGGVPRHHRQPCICRAAHLPQPWLPTRSAAPQGGHAPPIRQPRPCARGPTGRQSHRPTRAAHLLALRKEAAAQSALDKHLSGAGPFQRDPVRCVVLDTQHLILVLAV